MECKVFYAHSRQELQNHINDWLKTHPISPDSMQFQFSSVSIEDSTTFALEHTVVLFYVPMRAI